MEQDPRLMEVFSVLTGLDLDKMGAGAGKDSHEGHDHSEPHNEEDRKEEEVRNKNYQEEADR